MPNEYDDKRDGCNHLPLSDLEENGFNFTQCKVILDRE
jgi:hypothetical protein